jgi:hypothetical protein
MTPRLPQSAREVLERGVLCYLAVRSEGLPHLTPVVYALDGGRVWVTSSRGSVKARAWRRDPYVAGLVRARGFAVTFMGQVRTYDALDPLSWPAAAVAGPRLVRAGTRFTLKNARFFAGYAADAARIPLAWTPPGRVFAGIEPAAGVIFEVGSGEAVDSWGDWWTDDGAGGGATYRSTFAPLSRKRAIDLRVPRSVRAAVGPRGQGALDLDSRGVRSPGVLPIEWRRLGGEGSYEAALPRNVVELAAGSAHPRAALTIDRASTWRAADMAGMLLQGTADLFALPETIRGRRALVRRLAALGHPSSHVLVRLRPNRVVWWQGWTSGTVRAK